MYCGLSGAEELKQPSILILAMLLLAVLCSCSQEYYVPHEHEFMSEWTYDSVYHWHEPKCGHDVTSGRAVHSWVGVITSDGVEYYCTVCNARKIEMNPTDPDLETEKDELSIPEYLTDIKPIANYIPYFALEKSENGTYVYGVVGEEIHKVNGPDYYVYYAFPVEKDTVYYFSKTSWWGLVDSNGICIAGGGLNGENPAESINTGSYENPAVFYLSTAIPDSYFSKTEGGTEQGWTIDGLKVGNSASTANVFDIPSFRIPAGTGFRFYLTNCCLEKNLLSRITYYSDDGQYEGGYFISSDSVCTKNYILSVYDELLNSHGSCGFSVTFAEKNVRNVTALFIGDSTINAGKITQKVSDVFTAEESTCTLLGQRGSELNRHEGISGWTASGCWEEPMHGNEVNHFFDSSVGHFSFAYYIEEYGYSSPEFGFLQFGINDMFGASPLNIEDEYKAFKASLMNIIEDIHAYDTNIKIVVNLITLPNESEDVFRLKYGNSCYPWERRAADILTNARLIKDLPDYVIINPHNLVLDCSIQISDDVHMTDSGYATLGVLDANVMFAN